LRPGRPERIQALGRDGRKLPDYLLAGADLAAEKIDHTGCSPQPVMQAGAMKLLLADDEKITAIPVTERRDALIRALLMEGLPLGDLAGNRPPESGAGAACRPGSH